MRRRDFLKLVATSTTGAVLFTGCGWGDGDPAREFKIESPVLNPVDMNYNRDNWYATVYPGAGGGEGIIVRVFEGRAKKVEGNPDFPTALGASSPRAQAAVQELYHPDRIQAPMRLSGARGSGNYTQITWDEAFSDLAGFINDAKGTAGAIMTITPPDPGPLGRLVADFASAVGARQVFHEPDEYVVLREAMTRVFGVSSLPTLDLPRARFLVSFSADFLHTWISPVQFSMGYGEFRQGRPDVRGTYFHVGPQLSSSAASADKWLPILPGTEGLVALAMAQAMVSEGLVDAAKAGSIYGGINLDDYTPDTVAESSGLSADAIRDLAHRFATEKPAIAVAGTSAAAHTNGLFNLTAVWSLNLLVGSVGVPGGVILNPDETPFGEDVPGFKAGLPYSGWTDVANDLSGGAVKLVLVHGANPVYSLPPASGFQDALGSFGGKVVAMATVLDETAAQADLVLPVHTALESWGIVIPDPGPGYQTVALQQPVVNPFVDSTAFADILIRAASDAGTPLAYASAEELVRSAVGTIQQTGRGNVAATDAKEYFIAVQTQGGWWDTDAKGPSAPAAPSTPTPAAPPQFAGDPAQFPLYLLPFPSNTLDYGQTAHLPWLQALPEPISTNVWSTWVELSPRTADDLGVTTGDVVAVVSPNGTRTEVAVYVNPAAQPGVVLIPLGQGHTEYGRYAQKRGVNPLTMIDPQTDSETGALAWAATRVRLEKVDRKVRLPRFEGQTPAFQLPDMPIVEVTRASH